MASIRPEFEKFAAKFPVGSDNSPNFGKWSSLHKKGLAPTADDVPSDNKLKIWDFMIRFSAKHSERIPQEFPLSSRNIPVPSRNIPSFGSFFIPPQRTTAYA